MKTMKFLARFLPALLLAWTGLFAVQAGADSTRYTDLPLRTMNRAKPNVMMLLDNGQQSQRTYAPESFPDKLFPGIRTGVPNASSGMSWRNIVGNNGVGGFYIWNQDSLADTDWHYRSSGTGCSGANCLEKFNRLYFDPNFDYQTYRPAIPQGGSSTPSNILTPWEIVSALNSNGAFSYASGAQAAQLYGCIKNNSDCATTTSDSKEAEDDKRKCDMVWKNCAWLDGYNPDAGTVDLASGFSTAPYPPFPNQVAPSSWSNWSASATSNPTSSSNVLNWLTLFSPSVATSAVVLANDTIEAKFLDSTWRSNLQASTSCTDYQSPGANTCNYCSSFTRARVSGRWVYTCTVAYKSLPAKPTSFPSAQYCDTKYVDTSGISVSNPFSNPCKTIGESIGGPYRNPGEADFFDANYDGKNNKNGRHKITDTKGADDTYFGTNPSMGVGASTGADKATRQYNNIRNFVLWHSFFRTRLMAQKSALAYSIAQSGLNSNFRIGLATVVNGKQTGSAASGDGGGGTGDQITFGAYTADQKYHYFSAVSEFNTSHQSEWYQQLAKIQPSPFASQPDTLGTLHGLYLWFVGRRPDPVPPTGYLAQSSANTNPTYNSGATSQFTSVEVTNADGTVSQVTLSPARKGPFLYSCQNNLFTFLTSNWIGTPGTNRYNLQSDASYGLNDPYPTANSATPVVAAANNVRLPSYQTSICDPIAYPSDSGKNCATIANTATGATDDSNPWPYPFKAASNAYYASAPATTFADLALFYWSQDLNEQFNRSRACVVNSSTNPCIPTSASNGITKQGVKPFGSFDTVATWPHVTTNVITVGIYGSKTYTDASYNLIRPSDADRTLSTGSLYNSSSRPNAASDPAQDYYDPWSTSCVVNCTDPEDASTCTTSCTRPPSNVTSFDDMLHAAIAGHGNLASTQNVSDLQSALGTVWRDVLALSGSESAVAVANTQVSQTGTSYAFQSSYNTSGWWGDLVASPIQPTTGIISSFTFDALTCAKPAGSTNAGWSAHCQLRETLCPGYLTSGSGCPASTVPGSNHATSRIIITDNGSGTGMEFTSTNLSASQFNLYGSDADRVIAYLRGDSTYENCTPGATTGYRCRFQNGATIGYWNPMGDVVDSEAVVVGPPQTSYADTGYASFKNTQATRAPVVFQGSNDGMLHAFLVDNSNGTRGAENWAYIPGYVRPNLKELARHSYVHQYYVNATPAFGDVDFNNLGASTGSADWHTLLVGGLGKGGRGYYALNVTTPSLAAATSAGKATEAAGKVLWVFPHASSDVANVCSNTVANMGYTYGRPALVKIKSGDGIRWVALVTSGYDNGSTTGGDGKGHLYLLDAKTGACLKDIATSDGSSGTAIGLAYIAAHVADPTSDQTVKAVYGGDLYGNIWKFGPVNPATDTDISTWTVTKFAVLKDTAGNTQAVTAEPNVAVISGTPLVYVGTGLYLGTQDVPTSTNYKAAANYVGQSIYALADTGTINYASSSARNVITSVINGDCTDSSGNLTGSCSFGPQYCTVSSPLTRCFSSTLQTTLSAQTTVHPWLFDIPAGERIITSPVLVLGALMFTSNQPISDPCQPGGKSYFYMLDYRTGGAVAGSAFISQNILDPVTGDNVMASRPTIIQLPDGRVIGLVSTSVGATLQINNILSQPARRTSWREVPNY